MCLGKDINLQTAKRRVICESLYPWSNCGRLSRGVTLVELLVVVAILVILVGLTATFIQPLREGRDIREAARSVNALFAAAQARAIELQRPVGVWIRRFTETRSDPRINMGIDLFMAEVPPPYTGDDLNAHAQIGGRRGQRDEPQSFAKLFSATRPQTRRDDVSFTYFNVTKNDYIRFDYKGPLRRIIDSPGSDIEEQEEVVNVMFDPPIWYPNGAKVPFEVFRYGRPSQTSASRIQLPASVAIDIGNSGVGKSGTFYDPRNPSPQDEDPAEVSDVAILFSPSGGIELVIDGDPETGPQRINSALHLLIGRTDKLGADNLTDGNNLWISVASLTGRVTTSEIKSLTAEQAQELKMAQQNNEKETETKIRAITRDFAVEAQTMGGR